MKDCNLDLLEKTLSYKIRMVAEELRACLECIQEYENLRAENQRDQEQFGLLKEKLSQGNGNNSDTLDLELEKRGREMEVEGQLIDVLTCMIFENIIPIIDAKKKLRYSKLVHEFAEKQDEMIQQKINYWEKVRQTTSQKNVTAEIVEEDLSDEEN